LTAKLPRSHCQRLGPVSGDGIKKAADAAIPVKSLMGGK
jgi:hypothetical protein